MDNKKRTTIICVILAVFVIGFICYYKITNNVVAKVEQVVPEGYMCVFHGGSGEVTYSTYIYKDKKHDANYGFTYINTQNTTTHWGSSQWSTKITGKGYAGWTDEVFEVARKNNAYSYVEADGKTYSIEEYMNIFLMD